LDDYEFLNFEFKRIISSSSYKNAVSLMKMRLIQEQVTRPEITLRMQQELSPTMIRVNRYYFERTRLTRVSINNSGGYQLIAHAGAE